MSALDYLADRQALWSATANKLKAGVDRARWASFALSIFGALAASIATQTDAYRELATAIGAVALTIAAFLTSRFLTREALSRHLRARAASEALKREAFLYATGTGTYADATLKEAGLSKAHEKIEDAINDLLRYQAQASGPGSCPRNPLTLQEYLQKRVDGQIKFYETRASEYSRWSSRLHVAEWMFALAAAILTAVSGVIGKGLFDWAAITGVLTTTGGAVLAHLQASRFDELISSYRATAGRLNHAKQTAPTAATVQTMEDIIGDETKAWSAMWSK